MINFGRNMFKSKLPRRVISDNDYDYDERVPSRKKKLIRYILYLFAFIIIWSSFFTVDTSEKAIILRMGELDRIVGEGPHFKFPIVEEVATINVQVNKISVDTVAASKDLQSITSTIVLNYNIKSDTENIYRIYKTVGMNYVTKIIEPSIHELSKSVISQYTAEELITKRENVREGIKLQLRQRLNDYDMEVKDISITNFQFSSEFDKAIEAKLVAEQDALKANHKLDQIRTEGKQKIAMAEAEAASLKSQRQEITPELLELRRIEAYRAYIEKWNGVEPTTKLISEHTMPINPMFNIGK